MPRRRPLAALALAVAASWALAGCTPTVSMDAAPDANDAVCARVTVSLPDTVAKEAKRTTDAQATGAWGDPAAVLLRCGVTPIGPTTQPCVDATGVDWVLETAPDAKLLRYITYGRTPAIEIALDHTKVADYQVLGDLADAVKSVPQTRRCLGADDAATPTPAPGTTAPTDTPAPTPG